MQAKKYRQSPSWQSASLHRHTQKSSLKLYRHTKRNFSTVIVISGFREDIIPILHKLEASSLKKKRHQKKYCVDHCFSPMCAQRTCQKLMELVTNHITFCVCCLLNLPRRHNQHTCLLNRRNSCTTANRCYNRREFSSGAERRKFPIKKCLDTFISHLVDWTLRFPYATLQNKKKKLSISLQLLFMYTRISLK